MVTTLAVTALGAVAHLLLAPQPLRPAARVQLRVPPPVLQGPAVHHPVVRHAVPQVLCTMPMLRPDGDVDPKIVVEPPKNLDFKIRTIDAPPCLERPAR